MPFPRLFAPNAVKAATTGLVAAYSFNEGSGTTVGDSSGNSNTGTITAATWTAAGKFGSALSFNGTSAKITINNSASLNLTTGMTLEAWVNPAVKPVGWRSIIDKDVDNYYLMAGSALDSPAASAAFGNGVRPRVFGSSSLAANTWTHLAATYDGTALRLYVNGVLVSSQAQTGSIVASNNAVHIGANFYGEYFNGVIDEARIYNRALSLAEIQTDMATSIGPVAPDTTPPTAPTNLGATAASSTQINLSWTASTDNVAVTGYRVERCQGAGCTNFTQIATPAGTTFNDTGLTASASYSYQVRATDAANNLSTYSNTASATTPAPPDTTPPTAPTNLAATAAAGTQINLSWTASTDNVGVTGYRVERCQGAGCTTFAQIGTPTGTTFNDTGLTSATSYSYRVRATDAANNLSTYSNTASATTLDTISPSAPTNLGATAASNTQINLSWTASTDNVAVTGYRVERCQGAGCTNFTQIATPTGTTFNDTGLAASTSYSYRVRATDAANNLSGYSTTASATTLAAPDTTPPSAPTNLGATAASSTQINLSWTASTDNVAVTGYRVERCQGAGCTTFAQIATPAGTTFNDTGLASATSYSYRVRATDAASNLSTYSNTASATTQGGGTPSGLVAAYSFNEGSGTTVADSSGNSNTGTITGATWTTAGKYGSALSFNGTSAMVTINNSTSLNLTTGMTLEAWVNPAAKPVGWRSIIDKDVDNYYLMAGSALDSPAAGGTFGSGGVNQNVFGGSSLAANTWVHLAATYDGTALRLYINGVLAGTQAQTGAIVASTNAVHIGADFYGEYFRGVIDEVRIYNRALSLAEIQTDMNTPLTP